MFCLQFPLLYLLLLLTEVKFTQHTINHITCTVLWHLVHSQCDATTISLYFQNVFITPEHRCHSPLPHLLSDSIGLFILDLSYKKIHPVCDFLCLAPFTWHNAFEIHSNCTMSQIFNPFYA